MGKSKTKRRVASRAGGAKNRNKNSARKGTFKKVFIWIMIIISVLLVAGLAVGIAFVATDGFGGRVNTLTIEVGDESYTENAEGLIIYPDTVFKVHSALGYSYEVTIEASDRNDFEFSIGGEKGYRWKYLAGQDLTDYFDIVKENGQFKVKHTGINGILERYYGGGVSAVNVPPMDLFKLKVTCNNRVREFSFYPAMQRPTGVTVNPDNIIFGEEEEAQ